MHIAPCACMLPRACYLISIALTIYTDFIAVACCPRFVLTMASIGLLKDVSGACMQTLNETYAEG
jgi:hypothetical protein